MEKMKHSLAQNLKDWWKKYSILRQIKGIWFSDSFLGSATTAAVAHKMERHYIGIEMGSIMLKLTLSAFRKKSLKVQQGGISKSVEWQGGGGFSFYKLGNAVFDDQGFLNSDVKFMDLASYIWWLETKSAFNSAVSLESPFLGVHDGVSYFLLYNGILGDRRPNSGNVLTHSILNFLNDCHTSEGKTLWLLVKHSD